MKKTLSLLLAILVATTTITACTNADSNTNKVSKTKKLSIICTIFPEYDWMKQILGVHNKDVDLSLLVNNGTDLHSFQPNAEHMINIKNSNLFVYVGGESDSWVKDALKDATNKQMKVVNLLDVLGDRVKTEEHKEGMQDEHEQGDDADHDHDELDEHVWLSLENTIKIVGHLTETLTALMPEHAADFKNNSNKYISELKDLDQQYRKAVTESKHKTLLFGDRFPFRYLVDDYGLDYYSAFVGCSSETEASFETITFLATKVEKLGLPAVITIDGNGRKIAETIIRSSKSKSLEILVMDSMQSISSKEINAGASYLDIMKKNLEVLSKALK